MSKKTKSNFTYTASYDLPKLKKNVLEWDLKKLFYSSEKDVRIQKDLKHIDTLYSEFEKKYKNFDFTKSAKTLFVALEAYESLIADPAGSKVFLYFDYRRRLNAHDAVAQKQLNILEDFFAKLSNKIMFFELKLGNFSSSAQKQLLSNDVLKKYHYYLSRIFLKSKHTLSEPEERILNLTSAPGSSMWIQATEKILSNRLVKFRGKEMGLPEAIGLIETLQPKSKQSLWNVVLKELDVVADVAEHELNALGIQKKTRDELRSYKKSHSATVLHYENTEQSVEALVDAVTDYGFTLSRKFYNLKAKLSGQKKLLYVNRNDTFSNLPAIPYETAVQICRDAFYNTKEEYGRFFDQMLSTGTIDVYPKKGKRGGAFMSGDINTPTVVFLNYTDTFSSLETLAHEMGHAIHTERSKTQPPIYQNYSITTAETASTFFENVMFNHLIKQVDDSYKLALIHERLSRDISTIQRQIAFFNFEKEYHAIVRSQGGLTKHEYMKLMQKHLHSYLGNSVTVTERDGLSFVYVSHFRRSFYVYTYSYGIIVSNLLNKLVSQNKEYISEVDTFLQAGGSDTVENIFLNIGIDTSKKKTYMEGLKSFENELNLFEKIVKQKL